MAGSRSPEPTVRRRSLRSWNRNRNRSRSPPPKPQPRAPAASPDPHLLPGAEVEVRVDDGELQGSWFEARVVRAAPARGCSSTYRFCRYVVSYSHLEPDNGTVVAASRIRPRPPPPGAGPAPPRFLLHDVVEAFHRKGWLSGIVVAAAPDRPLDAPVTVAFPVTREAVALAPHLVRPRRDYVEGQWVPSPAPIPPEPRHVVRVYELGGNVEVTATREVYGRSWFPATVAKVVDHLSYLVEYATDNNGTGGEAAKMTEYLYWGYIRPAAEQSLRESGSFELSPGFPMEAYCDGAWSPGVVHRVVADGEYEISVGSEGTEQLVRKAVQLLQPQYDWDGRHWSIVRAKRQANLRRQPSSRKRPSSNVEQNQVPENYGIKKSMNKRQQEEVLLAEGSVDASSCRSLATNNRLTSCSLLPAITSNMVLSENEEGITDSMQSLHGKNDASDNVQIQLEENNVVSCNETISALSASLECQTAVPRNVRPSDVVSRWSNKGSCTWVYTSEISRKEGFNGQRSLQSSLDTTIDIEQNGREEVKEPFKGSSLALEDAIPQSKQKTDRTSGDTLDVNEVIDPMLSPMVPGGSEPIHDGINMLSHLGECPPAIIKSTCRGNRNADVLTDNVVVQAAQSNHLMETPMLSVDCLVQQDGGHVNERSPLLWLQNAGNSPCTTESGVLGSSSVAGNSQCTSQGCVLRSCFVSGTSMPQDMALPQVSDHQVPFVKSSPLWHVLEEMDVFKMVPQHPHFHALQKHAPSLREGMAIGMMVTFSTLVGDIRKSNIEDSVESFEDKIKALRELEENGFNVEALQGYIGRLFQVKSDYLKHLNGREHLKSQILDKKTSLSRISLLLDENDRGIAEQENRLANLRSKGQEIAKQRENEEEELSSLESADRVAEEACGDVEEQFRITLAELRRKHLT